MGLKSGFYIHMTSLNPEVTGSLHPLTVNYPDGRQTNFIVDCGLYQEKGVYPYRSNRKDIQGAFKKKEQRSL